MLEKQKIRKAALLVMKKILLLTTGGTIASSDTGSGFHRKALPLFRYVGFCFSESPL